jgi:uncharacterized protein YkwD
MTRFKFLFAIAFALASFGAAFVIVSADTPTVDTSGFTVQNDDGTFGPYSTPDMPVLTDRGGYVQSGEGIESFSDQYGNDYWLDMGVVPTPADVLSNTIANLSPSGKHLSVGSGDGASPDVAHPLPPIRPTPSPTVVTHPGAQAAIHQVNIERQKAGISPLVEDPALDAFALAYASYEARTQCYGHACPGEAFKNRAAEFFHSDPQAGYRLLGETIHLFPNDGSQVVDNTTGGKGFMQSPPHKAILMDPRLTRIGAAQVPGDRPVLSGPSVDGPMTDAQVGALQNQSYNPDNRYWVLNFSS